MNIFSKFRADIVKELEAMTEAGALPSGLDLGRVGVEPPRWAEHGDMAANAAMVLAKPAGQKPRDLADQLVLRLRAHGDVVEAAVAGPGFINIRLRDDVWRRCLLDVLAAGSRFGDSRLGE